MRWAVQLSEALLLHKPHTSQSGGWPWAGGQGQGFLCPQPSCVPQTTASPPEVRGLYTQPSSLWTFPKIY